MAVARARVPKQVGRYQLIYELGTSYLGPLWAARVETGDTLALLRLVSLARLDSESRVRLLEAAWQAMEVRDDRVLPVTDVVASDGELSVVSEYAEGLPLRAVQTLASVRRKPMSVPVALRFILDLTDGVVALHRAMTELGDEAVPLFGGVSADSVLVGADGRASLLDVAIASAASGVELLGKSPERVAYAAPEQLGDKPQADVRTDVFSVGTLAWELLANRRLFVGSDKAVAQKVLAAKVPKLEDAARKGEFQVPKRLGAAILRALSLDPGARFESMEAFRSELDAAGAAPAEPADVASYVAAIADGAFARTREALSLPPRPAPAHVVEVEKPAPSPVPAPAASRAVGGATKPEATRPNLTPKASSATLTAARPFTEARAGAPVRPVSQARLAMPARPTVATKAAPAMPVQAKAATPSIPKPEARASIEAKPEARPNIEAKPEARPNVEPKPEAPPNIETKPEARPNVEPKPEAPPSVTTSKRVSIEPKPGDGWRSLDAPQPRSALPAQIRPRQQTMIGLPAPAGLSPSATPPAPPVTEPPPSSSEEPTTQYSREHLRHLADLHTAAPSTEARLPDVAPPAAPANTAPDAASPDVMSEPAPSKLVSEPPPPILDTKPPPAPAEPKSPAREVALPRLVSLRPMPRALSELHTDRPPPPEPEPTPPTPHAAPGFAAAVEQPTLAPAPLARATAGLPPAPEGVEPVRIAAPPPARMDATGTAVTTPYAPSTAPRSIAPRNQDVASGPGPRPTERPAFSRPPPATVAASIYPSQVVPPLIHDPRANRAPSIAPERAPRRARGLVLGALASVALVALSATVALMVMRHHGSNAAAEEVHSASAGARSESLAATASPVTPPAATTTTAPPEEAPPQPTASVAADSAEVPPGVAASANPESSNAAATASAPQQAPVRAMPSRAPHAAHKSAKKHGRFVPSDI